MSVYFCVTSDEGDSLYADFVSSEQRILSIG